MNKGLELYGYANGHYYCTCQTCKNIFAGDKRAVNCYRCAYTQREKETSKITPMEAMEILKSNYPSRSNTILRKAIDMSITLLEKQITESKGGNE